ncbi:MAG: tRNA (N6-threonylcarbamoyladenosine(37)-N6)-methyltransferase TrmO [Spirochaetaceae bacterium]
MKRNKEDYPGEFTPIGYVATEAESVPRFYSISDITGRLVIRREVMDGLSDIAAGEPILVIFLFHNSPPFTEDHLRVTPPHREQERGVFSTRSPVRPNPIGLSELEVLDVEENIIYVKGLDMIDGTPILDIKPVK